MRTQNTAILIIVCAIAIYFIGESGANRDDLQMQQDEYCEMTKLFKETKGEHGWPDYRGIAARVCK